MPLQPAAARRILAALALAAVATWLLAASLPTHAREHREAEAQREVLVDELPSEAHETLARIHAGGPFPFERDGITFGNRERRLPQHKRGYYHEYTVVTPGLHTRGARRIICGGTRTAPDACWYTDDHYRTFRRIRE